MLGGSSHHLLLDVIDSDSPVAVFDRLVFRMGYGAMLLAMTSEYVEKTPIHDVEETPGRRMVQIVADADAGPALARHRLGERLEAIGLDVVHPDDVTRLPAGLMRLTAGRDRRVTLQALAAAVKTTHSLGLIWIDSIAALTKHEGEGEEVPQASVLARALGRGVGLPVLQPQLSPENVVILGLREATPAEAGMLKASRVTVFTMAEIDAVGIGHAMREAIRIVSSGTRGFHVSYSPTATAFPGWAEGSGGMSVRETHKAFAAVALSGGMISMDIAPFGQGLDASAQTETLSLVTTAFGSRIL